MNETIYLIAVNIANAILWAISSRMAYGSWPWEAHKTWHWTRDEIKFLRDVNENNRARRSA